MINERMMDFSVMILKIIQQMEKGWDSRMFAEQAIMSSIEPTLKNLSGETEAGEDLIENGLPIIISLFETNQALDCIMEMGLHPEPCKVKVAQEECKKLIASLLQKISIAS